MTDNKKDKITTVEITYTAGERWSQLQVKVNGKEGKKMPKKLRNWLIRILLNEAGVDV